MENREERREEKKEEMARIKERGKVIYKINQFI